jgi:hypothetical protein
LGRELRPPNSLGATVQDRRKIGVRRLRARRHALRDELAQARAIWPSTLRVPGKHHVRNGAPLTIDGERQWRQWEELWVADDDFDAVAGAFAASTGLQRSSPVGEAEAHLLPMRTLVDFAARWFPQHRTARHYAGDTTGW